MQLLEIASNKTMGVVINLVINRRTLLILTAAVFAVIGTTTAGCSGKPDPDAGLTVLNRSLSSDPESLDPQKARSTQAADVLRDIGEGLIAYDPTGELVAAGAERWTVSEDGLTYTFELRANARWSTGEPVTAADYVFGLQRLVDPASATFYASAVSAIVNAEAIIRGELPAESLGVRAEDSHTLAIDLSEPTLYLLGLLTHPSTFPAHRGRVAAHGEDYALPGNLPSNGAYLLESWEPGSLVKIRRNTEYWNDGNTAIDVVYHHVITQEAQELNRYRAGELHITTNVPPESFQQVREEYGEQLRVYPTLGVYYYGFNLDREPFADQPRLRQALSMAIDREVLVEKITGRGEAPAYSWVPPGIYNYEPPRFSYANLTQDERNRIARSLYREAGYGEDNPLRFELRYNTSDTQRRIALAVQAMWREVLGAEAELVNVEFQVLLDQMRAAEITQMFRSSWLGDYNDAYTFLGVLESDSPSNMPRYVDEEYDDLLQNAASQVDADRRRLYLEEAERVLLADHPVIPLYFYVSKHLVDPRIRGWGDNPLDYHYSQHLSFDAAD